MSLTISSPRIMQELTATQADLERHAVISAGVHVACWQRHTLQDTAYQQPGHHTLSCYLHGGEQIRRRDQPSLRGGPGKLCLLPAEHESYWQVGGYIHFLHLYFTPQYLAHQIVELFDCEPRSIVLADRTYIDLRNARFDTFSHHLFSNHGLVWDSTCAAASWTLDCVRR